MYDEERQAEQSEGRTCEHESCSKARQMWRHRILCIISALGCIRRQNCMTEESLSALVCIVKAFTFKRYSALNSV